MVALYPLELDERPNTYVTHNKIIKVYGSARKITSAGEHQRHKTSQNNPKQGHDIQFDYQLSLKDISPQEDRANVLNV